jgi:hypothetical protein
LEFGDEFPDEALHERRVEDAGGLRETAQGTARYAEYALDLLEGTGLLKAAQGLADGVEHEEEQQGHVLVHVEGAVMGAVAPAPGVVEAFQKARDLLEILESLKIGFLNLTSFWMCHAYYENILLRWAQEKTWGIWKFFSRASANGVPNRIGTQYLFQEFR